MNVLKILSLVLIMVLTPESGIAETHDLSESQKEAKWGNIDTQTLETLLQSKISLALVDARKDKYFDGFLIRGGKRLPSDSSEESIQAILPSKNQLIVVYCAGKGCDASKNLAKRLIEMGYKNVIDYHDGIRVWKAQNKPVVRVGE